MWMNMVTRLWYVTCILNNMWDQWNEALSLVFCFLLTHSCVCIYIFSFLHTMFGKRSVLWAMCLWVITADGVFKLVCLKVRLFVSICRVTQSNLNCGRPGTCWSTSWYWGVELCARVCVGGGICFGSSLDVTITKLRLLSGNEVGDPGSRWLCREYACSSDDGGRGRTTASVQLLGPRIVNILSAAMSSHVCWLAIL